MSSSYVNLSSQENDLLGSELEIHILCFVHVTTARRFLLPFQLDARVGTYTHFRFTIWLEKCYPSSLGACSKLGWLLANGCYDQPALSYSLFHSFPSSVAR